MTREISQPLSVHLSDLIAPSFHEVHRALRRPVPPAHVYLNGGRGSTKSSFVAIEIILGMMQDKTANAVVLRKVADTLRDSVFEQYQWAIETLGVSHLWHASISPLRLTYRGSGSRLLFKGADDPSKIKSIKFARGRLKYVHYEELDEFGSMKVVRKINQSLVRGTEAPTIFYTYNPPASLNNWVNAEAVTMEGRDDALVHTSTYLTVPRAWLGEQFIAEAEHLKKVNLRVYEHEYLGKPVGTGAEVFKNIIGRKLSERQIAHFDKTHHGLDFGFAADPTALVSCYYNPAKQRLVIYDEVYQQQLTTEQLATKIKDRNLSKAVIVADSAEPRTIHDLRSRDIVILGAKKGAGSVDHGIKWLQDLAEIIIDPDRCPNAYREFTGYELARDTHGNLKGVYPDKDNHSIDATRYATEKIRRAWVV